MQYAIVTRKFYYDMDSPVVGFYYGKPLVLDQYRTLTERVPFESSVFKPQPWGDGCLKVDFYAKVYKHLKNGKVSVESVCGNFACDIDPIHIGIVSLDSIPYALKNKYISLPLET